MIAQINGRRAFLVDASPRCIGPNFMHVPLRDLRSDWGRFQYLCHRRDIDFLQPKALIRFKPGFLQGTTLNSRPKDGAIWQVIEMAGGTIILSNYVERGAMSRINAGGASYGHDLLFRWGNVYDNDVSTLFEEVSSRDARSLVNARVQEILAEQEERSDEEASPPSNPPPPPQETSAQPPAPSIWNRLKEELAHDDDDSPPLPQDRF